MYGCCIRGLVKVCPMNILVALKAQMLVEWLQAKPKGRYMDIAAGTRKASNVRILIFLKDVW